MKILFYLSSRKEMKKWILISLLGIFFYGCSNPTEIKEGDTKEIQALKTDCAAGDLESCANLGVKYGLGQDVKKDIGAAKDLFEKSCKGDNPIGCYNIGVIYRDKKDFSKAIKSFEQSCEKGFGQSCYSIGVMYKNAEGVEQDLDHSADFFTKACDLNNPYGCLDACAFYKDDAQGDKALPLCEKACDLDNAAGCFNASDLYFTKYQDVKNTLFYSKRACELGIDLGCSNTAFLYTEGKLIPKNLDEAITYFDKACKLGNQDACDNSKTIQDALPKNKDSKTSKNSK